MVYVCSHKSRVVTDKFGKNCENSMFFARDDGFSQLTTYGCIFGTFRYHIRTQRKKPHKIHVFLNIFWTKIFRSPLKFSKIFENFQEFVISKCQNVMFPRRNFARKDDSTHLKLLKWLIFAKKAKWVPEMSKFGSNHDFRPVLEMPWIILQPTTSFISINNSAENHL